ncbi:hypothetical protein [Actinomadura madurae]|uniref:hypothetical protein n=1 Tax=Actinomadura madurae TaxID=1993 RepID=UPI000D83FCB2|nr:hypothetical protein [Actinomadura madurae]SPT49494.1 Uncharacterised protein [Actinomadura madurae]
MLASDPWVDLVYDQIEESGVDEASVIREPFESAPYQNGISAPALADIGVSCSRRRSNPCTRLQSAWRPGGLEAWSGERYERGRRLILMLYSHVEDGRDDERAQGMADLLEQLALPTPKY